jgi:hypothetical protein
MTQRRSVSVTIWGVLSILAGALMTEGGVMEVIAYWPQGQTSNVVVGALGALASALLLVSGVAFCTKRPFGRQTAVAGAIGMAPIHLLGWILGFVGVPGALLGVAYPTLLLFVLRAKPNLGAPTYTEARPAGIELPPPSNHTKRRAALSAA